MGKIATPVGDREKLGKESLVRAYRRMLRARLIDEKAIVLYKQNKCHFQIGCAGHEAVQLAAADLLSPGKDWSFPYYRDMAFCVGLGMSTEDFFRNILNKPTDPNSGGRQMPMHYGSAELRIVNQSSPTGTQYLQAVGAALSGRYRKTDEVVYVSSGEGTCAQGDYHEALNWAAREKLPVIFLIEDNKFAISVPVEDQHAGSVSDISSGYRNLDVVRVEGFDYEQSYYVMEKAVQRARNGEGPTVVHADVIRLQSHSISDNQAKYRKPAEIESDRELDPLALLHEALVDRGYSSDDEIDSWHKEISSEVNAAAETVEAEDDIDPESWNEHILKNPTPWIGVSEPDNQGEPQFMVDAINKALHEEMRRNPEMLVYGQDVAGSKGGVFSATEKLTASFGEDRCFNSPLAESSIIGTAVGLAATGMKPVVEIQFGDYIWTAMMQLRNELAKMLYRSNGTYSSPAVVRVPVGGYIHGGPYHSQSIEATFAHIAGLIVLFPSNAGDAKGLLKSAIRSEDPVIFSGAQRTLPPGLCEITHRRRGRPHSDRESKDRP